LSISIFITIPWFLPSYRAGGPIQSIANLVNNYSEGVQYFIFCGDRDLNGEVVDEPKNQWLVYNAYTRVWYAEKGDQSNQLVEQSRKINPHHLFIIGLYSWHFNIVPMIFAEAENKIISVRGMLHKGALTQKAFKKKVFLKMFRLLGFQKKASFHATDDQEAKFIYHHFGEEAKINIAGNFPRNIGWKQPLYKEVGYLKMISIALISPMKNILEVLIALRSSVHSIQYIIYGPIKDTIYWQECLQVIAGMPANIVVEYYEEIEPARVPGVLHDCHIFILPSKSENFGHAIFEALSAGRPVITSENTPWNKLKESKAGINSTVATNNLKSTIDFFAVMGQGDLNEWSGQAYEYSQAKLDKYVLLEQYNILFSKNTEIQTTHNLVS